MPIQIIVENGTGVQGANSYVSVIAARAFAANRGLNLSEDDDVVAAQLINAFDYIETKECEFQGSRVYIDSAFPRNGVRVNCREIPNTEIPMLLISAQIQLVMAQENGIDIMPNFVAADYVTKEKVGPLETTYADPLAVGISRSLARSMRH